MIDYPQLRSHAERYLTLSTEPLQVTLVLRANSHLAGYDPLNLDNLLARAVVDDATDGRRLPESQEPYSLPAPIKCLWRSAEGLPLWAATPFYPVGRCESDVAYWHKRVQTGRWSGTKRGTFAIRSTNGRWMERRVPLPTRLAEAWAAECVGNAEEIGRLLRRFAHVGKRRSNGFGEVREWRIKPIERFTLLREDKLTRAIPALALLDLGIIGLPEGTAAPVGWTPPQWKPSLFLPGWWPGTPVRPYDFFEAP